MKSEDLIKILLPWNFWEKDIATGICREKYTAEALKYLKAGKIVTAIGIRRSGKSFLTKQIVKEFIEKSGRNNTLIVNLEEVKFSSVLNERLLVEIYEAYKEILKPDKKPLIILDEVQEVKKWERFVRTLDERKEALFVITGSSAKIMSEELATLLTGRALPMEVFPLSFREFLKFRGIEIKTKYEMIKNEGNLKALLKEFLQYGGFPEIVLEGRKEIKMKILRGYYDDILNKDVIKRFSIRRMEKLERIAFYFITNSSSAITFNRMARFLGISEKTVEIYSKYLGTSKIIFFIRRFSSSLKEQENSPRKVYTTDTGFYNLSNVLFSDRVSKLYENLVAIELMRRHGNNSIFYWKDKQHREVDFVIKERPNVKQLIQVCWNTENIDTKERETKALLKASKELKCRNLLVITEGQDEEEKIKGKTIKYVPLWKWLLA